MKLYTIILSFLYVTTSIFAEKTFDGNSLKGWNGDPKFGVFKMEQSLGRQPKKILQKGTHLSFGKVGV